MKLGVGWVLKGASNPSWLGMAWRKPKSFGSCSPPGPRHWGPASRPNVNGFDVLPKANRFNIQTQGSRVRVRTQGSWVRY
jgi:hypothetical protein